MRRLLILPSIVALLAGCPSADEPPARGEAQLNLVGEYPEGSAKTFPGLAVIPNIDDDNDNGTPDWADTEDDGLFEEEDDLASFTIPVEVWVGIEEGESFRLELHGQARNFRIWHDEEVVLGDAEDGEVDLFDLPASAPSSPLEFFVEARGMLVETWLSVDRLKDGEVTESDWSYITGAPLILHHHLQQTEHVWAMDVPESGSTDLQRFYNNQHMVETYEDVLGDQFSGVPVGDYGGDVWIQDEIQLAYMTMAGQRTDVVIDSIRDRALDPFPEELIVGNGTDIGDDVVNETWGNPLQANSLDSFGNLEVSPPVTVDGVHYPFGRVYFGGDSSRYPSRDLTDFLESQKIQDPFMPDTSWLCVGHIDEVTSVVPDPSSDIGFKFVIADIPTAWEILDQADAGLSLPRYARSTNEMGHGLATVGSIVNSNALRMENEEIQEDILDPMREQFMEELNLTDEDIILMPSLFENLGGCGDAALIPGMVNMIVANRDDDTDIFLADPFTRNSDDPRQGQEEDPVIAHVRESFPDTVDLHFVDNWAVYHAQLGEVHCGTNMIRTPEANWWNVAGHLFDGEEE